MTALQELEWFQSGFPTAQIVSSVFPFLRQLRTLGLREVAPRTEEEAIDPERAEWSRYIAACVPRAPSVSRCRAVQVFGRRGGEQEEDEEEGEGEYQVREAGEYDSEEEDGKLDPVHPWNRQRPQRGGDDVETAALPLEAADAEEILALPQEAEVGFGLRRLAIESDAETLGLWLPPLIARIGGSLKELTIEGWVSIPFAGGVYRLRSTRAEC